MNNTFLAEICRRFNRAKVLLKIVLVSASLGLILSILTDFLPYELPGSQSAHSSYSHQHLFYGTWLVEI